MGEYKCRYENRVGFVEKKFLLQVISNGGDNTMIAVIVILIIIAFLLMMMARILYVRFSVLSRVPYSYNINQAIEYI